MKRFRLFGCDFDTRASILNHEINEERDNKIKDIWNKNKDDVILGLKFEYGELNFEQKLRNFMDFGSMPLSVIYYHNSFFFQIRNSFVVGSYYPALTGVCSLGERILNHLINCLKDDFKTDINLEYYKDVYRKDTFKSDNWEKMITILDYWNIFEDGVSEIFKELKDIRNSKAVHFDIKIEDNDILRRISLNSIKLMYDIIDKQFGWIGKNKKWLIEGTRGAFFIKKESENNPFVKKIILPSCVLVGNKHKCEMINGRLGIIDNFEYIDEEVTDEEFAKPYL